MHFFFCHAKNHLGRTPKCRAVFIVGKAFGLVFFFPPRFRDIKSNEKKLLYLNLIVFSTPNLIVFSTPFQGAQWFRCAYKPTDWQPWLLYSGKLSVWSWGCHIPLHVELWTELWEEVAFLILSSLCFFFFPIIPTAFIHYSFFLMFWRVVFFAFRASAFWPGFLVRLCLYLCVHVHILLSSASLELLSWF